MGSEMTMFKEVLTFCAQNGMDTGFCANNEAMYHPELRHSCESNVCGAYGRNYTCPPLLGTVEECMERALAYPRLLVFRKVYPLEDSYDFYGMMEAKEDFGRLHREINRLAKAEQAGCLVLGAGGCTLCERCGAADNIPCRFPEEALSSWEGHCIQVSELAAMVGLKYIGGQNTVTYFGAVLYKEA